MLRAMEFSFNGRLHRIELRQDITDPLNPKLKIILFCPLCCVRAQIDQDMLIGKVSMKCENNLSEGIGLKVNEQNQLERINPEQQDGRETCAYHETHDFLDVARKQIQALGKWAKGE